MKIYELKRIQILKMTMDQAWDFFSSPENLKTITPPYMGFTIKSNILEQKMYPGMIISYVVKPLLGISLSWTTEITHVVEPDFFVDEQRFGPYKLWHHKHFFKEMELPDGKTGVHCTDHVHYAVGYGIAGRIANNLIVKKRLNEIFDFRRKTLAEMFGELKNPEKL